MRLTTMDTRLLLTSLLAVVCAVHGQYEPRAAERKPEVDQQCMDCICQASSNCDTSIKCHNSGGAYFCGPYVVSWGYWHDAGRPGDRGRPHDFESCLNNRTCAEAAVRGYMRKHGRDCDGDAQVTCHDFARIHKLGYGDCANAGPLEASDYWQKFQVCYEGYPPGQPDSDLPAPADYGDDYGEEIIDSRRPQQQG